ncbi:type IV toxin-antitoxin system AbiEi family antitoxin domain-containing protein [Streptomyces kanamyceticus]|uniref:type IV toxin-antitoxin system AbiEi family antitoxin domain-containing protein n=1 Tax=Streptomyces kanamyceticus TaxID=1967 RepID=UPI000AEE8B7B|nr:type IV toxin-antitoxin system AbiEi family antitoxin domain-containing protein [Streptomyces kanamyceticus]
MLTDRTDTRATLWRVASGQHGYFTAAQALKAGYSYQAQRYHAQRGNWLPVDRGIYRFREFTDLPASEDAHLVRWCLWSRGRAVASHTTALSIHDLGIANPSQIHLTVPRNFRQKDAAVILHRAELTPDEIEDRSGYRVTAPVRAIAECAAAGTEQDVLDSAVAEALERGVATKRQLLHAVETLGPKAELGVERALATRMKHGVHDTGNPSNSRTTKEH